MFEAMNRAISYHQLHPVIDRIFPFSDVPAAYQALQQARHIGKIVIQL
jgi:NADPH:quinone reductase-like Zn-dependent oxidoreductase